MSESALALRPDETETLQRAIRILTGKVERLEGELDNAHEALQAAKAQSAAANHALKALRKSLDPIHTALQLIYGELDTAGIEGESVAATAGPNSRVTAVWDSWKRKLSGNRAAIIDALLDHGRMNVAQLSVATHTPRKQTIYDSIHSMTKLGLIDKSGDMFSLKEL
jgi:chromosome segregation ATPase